MHNISINKVSKNTYRLALTDMDGNILGNPLVSDNLEHILKEARSWESYYIYQELTIDRETLDDLAKVIPADPILLGY